RRSRARSSRRCCGVASFVTRMMMSPHRGSPHAGGLASEASYYPGPHTLPAGDRRDRGMARWEAFAAEEPALAAFGEERLRGAPASLATVREDGVPRVHPVTPIVGAGGLYLFMEPTSPKGRDLRERGSFPLPHGGPNGGGTGG